MIMAYAIPANKIENNIKKSQKILESEGNYPASFDSFMIRLSLSDGVDIRSLILNNRGFSLDEFTTNIMFSEAAQSGELPVYKDALYNSGYSRYWHGYLAILRPMLLIFDYASIRIFNIIAMGIMLLSLIYMIYKQYGRDTMLVFTFATFMIWPFVIPVSLQYCTASYVALIATIILLKTHKINYSVFFLIVGMCTSYIDLLTFPLITYGIPMFFVLKDNEEKNTVSNIIILIKNGIIWCCGYVGMWAAKWVLATLILKKNIISDALEQVAFRSSSDVGDGSGVAITPLKAIFANACNYTNIIFLAAVMIFFIYVLICRKNKKYEKIFCMANIPYYVLMMLPFIWYGIFKNHSYIHGAFTYRALIISWTSGAYILIRKN